MALAFMNIGEKRKVMKLHGKDEVVRHLQDLDLHPAQRSRCWARTRRV